MPWPGGRDELDRESPHSFKAVEILWAPTARRFQSGMEGVPHGANKERQLIHEADSLPSGTGVREAQEVPAMCALTSALLGKRMQM